MINIKKRKKNVMIIAIIMYISGKKVKIFYITE